MLKNRLIKDLQKVQWNSPVKLFLDKMPTPGYLHPRFKMIYATSQRFGIADYHGKMKVEEFYAEMLAELTGYIDMRLQIAERRSCSEYHCFIYAAPVYGWVSACYTTGQPIHSYLWRRAEIFV